MFCIIHLLVIYFASAVSGWSTIFEWMILVYFFPLVVLQLTSTLQSWTLFDYLCCIFHVHHHFLQSSFCSEFGWLISYVVLLSKFMIFWYSILAIYTHDYNNQSSSMFCWCLFDEMYLSLGIPVGCTDVSVIRVGIVDLLGPCRSSLKQF